MEVRKDFLDRLGISLTVGFMLLLHIITDSAAVDYFTFWVILYPCLVPLEPVVSMFIHVICLFVTLLGSNFLPDVLAIVFLIGGIILVPFWIFLFGLSPIVAPFCIEGPG